MFNKHIFSLATVLLTAAVMPQVVYAQTAQVELSVTRQGNESYESFLNRAEAIAKKAIDSHFAKDKSLQDIKVTLLGENQLNISPIFDIAVSRNNWKSNPNPETWANYYTTSKYLLGFENPGIPSASTTPTQVTASPPPPPPNATTPPASTQTPPDSQTTFSPDQPNNGVTQEQNQGLPNLMDPDGARRRVFQGR